MTAPSEAKAASREYVFEMDEPPGLPPLLAIIGGKITTYRRLAEAALERLGPVPAGADRDSPRGLDRPAAAAGRRLRPGRLREAGSCIWRATTRSWRPPTRVAWRTPTAGRRGACWARRQPPRTSARRSAPRLTEAEVRYLIEQEWARTAEDVVWRRSKLGLRLTPAEIAALDAWMRDAVSAS